MRKQLYFALAALLLGTAAVPEAGHAATLCPAAPATTGTELSTATGSDAAGLLKRKKRKKNRARNRRR